MRCFAHRKPIEWHSFRGKRTNWVLEDSVERNTMKTIEARVLDSTHLELSQPISASPGESIRIAIPEEGDDGGMWRDAARKRFLDAYDQADSIYDRL